MTLMGCYLLRGMTKAQCRRMKSALERLQWDKEKLDELRTKQDGGLNPSQTSRYERIAKEVESIRMKIGVSL